MFAVRIGYRRNNDFGFCLRRLPLFWQWFHRAKAVGLSGISKRVCKIKLVHWNRKWQIRPTMPGAPAQCVR